MGETKFLTTLSKHGKRPPGVPGQALPRVSGVRAGKTVLLNALGDVAREYGFRVVDVAANAGFCDRILGALARNREVSSLSISPSIPGVSLDSVGISKSATQLGQAMYEASRNGGLLITLDEIQDAPLDEMRELGNEIQLLVRQGANVAFAFAGFPASVDGVVMGETLTFLQRAKHVELKRLMDFEVGDSFEETMVRAGKSVAPGVADALTAAATGYPFMVQLVGYYTWQSASRRGSDAVELCDAEKGIATARRSFDSMMIEPALRHVSGKQLEYLSAMARCGFGLVASGDIAREMGVDSTSVSTYRRRLVDAALIEAPSSGMVSFAIPYMREYLLEHVRE